ncbi:nucleoside/nucleotide kinase family protein [Streptomyces sp. SLBN-31]|uniref:nucleoside/nucleotide kinase family protein n=1 Tax=Streptomyces sp. SLBN-31 TaxID=2768444 RepID=UPI00115047B3|nr:nucleoside/nucleotide kinase family protein [Streptomyces sp. SLBN-31]TQJ92982.1 ArgK protein [Streptomyces sp. SLBN-31]
MTSSPVPHAGTPTQGHWTFTTLVERARSLARSGRRVVLGIAGPPGAGKSTLAHRLAAELGADTAVVVPMDGFHLADAELRRLGRRQRKGAPDTFDTTGYLALLRRLRERPGHCVYAPRFCRSIEDPVAGAIPVQPEVPLVITEGNYLLLEEGPWRAVRPLLDEAWYLTPDPETRLGRLIERHIAHGKPPEEARRWSLGSDQRNADRIDATRSRADLVFAPPLLPDSVTEGETLT